MSVETAFTGLHIRGRTYCPGATTALISGECRLNLVCHKVATAPQIAGQSPSASAFRLRSNTRRNAWLMGLEGEVGVIASGKLVDIVI